MPVTETQPSAANDPKWEFTPDATHLQTDPGALATTGYEQTDAPDAGNFNWLFAKTYAWFKYLRDVLNNSYAVNHDITSGQHTKIAYLTASPRAVTLDLGSPAVPGAPWGSDMTRGSVSAGTGMPAGTFHSKPSGTGLTAHLCQLPLPKGPDDASAGDHFAITSVSFLGLCNSPTKLDISVWKQKRDQATPAADVQVGTTFSVGNSASVVRSTSTNPAGSIDPAYRYYVRVDTDPNASINEIEIHNIEVLLSVKKNEFG